MNPLAIRIAADLKEFKRNMQEMALKLETNQAAMKRMSNAFDGNKLIGDANAMAIAIDRIGGASKLTEAEQRRVNATVTEALAKYQALGRTAPADLIALRDATQKVNAETAKTPSLMDQMSSKATAFGVAAGTFLGNMAWSAVNKLGAELGEFAQRGLQLNAVQSSFERLAKGTNQSSTEMLKSMQTASRGMVSEFDLMKAANKAMLLGLPVTSSEMGTLSKAAVTLGRAMGQDATKSVDDLITALGRSSPMILDNLGITVKVGEANEIYAAKLGKTVTQLTEAEKKTAFYEEAMRKANDKTKELGESTKTLGEMLQTAWVSIGNVVTQVVSDYNIGLGAAFSSTKNFAQFLQIAFTDGMASAVQFFAALERGKITVDQHADGFKKVLEEQIKARIAAGEHADAIAKIHGVTVEYVVGLKAAMKSTAELTAEQKAAITEAQRFQEAVDRQKDRINGVVKPTKEWAAAIKQLGMDLQTLPKGPGTGVGFFDSLPAMNDGIRVFNQQLPTTTSNVKSFFDTLRVGNDDMKNVFMSPENMQFLPTPGMIDLATGELIPAMAASGQKGADSFLGSLKESLSNMGNIIVGAIQGGGDVLGSIFASLGNSLGSIFGKSLEKSIGGMLGSLLGGLGGPIGALLGGLAGKVGSFLGGLFGGNDTKKGREQLAKMMGFGSLDSLYQELRGMGEEGARLVEAGLNKIGKGDKAANEAWMRSVEELFARYRDEAEKTGDVLEEVFKGPEGARGFPTKAQLEKAARDAEEAYRYMAASGEYTADVLEKAWQQWQDAMIASGDETAKRMKDLATEITSLQKAVEAETPEYDADGVRIYGVEEQRNIERLAALEREKAALVIAAIENEKHAVEEAAKAADLTATKEFEAAKLRAINLDGYLQKLFSKGYEIPITFRLPGGLPTGSGLPTGGGPFGNGAPLPTLPSRASAAPVNITVPVLLDGREVARNQVKYIPRELDFIGARR